VTTVDDGSGDVDNPFLADGIGARYARGRPYHHPRGLARALALLGEERAGTALDVACGTGMSTRALADVADLAIGADRSPEMLAIAATRDDLTFVRTAGELLPFPDNRFDGITVCSGIHWLDQPRFYAEARRVLRPNGWIALYDHYFIGEMVDVPEFREWAKLVLERFPLPPRNPQVGDPRGEQPDGFAVIGDEFYPEDIRMSQDEFADYQLSLSTFIAAEAGGTSRAELRAWLLETTAPFFADANTRAVRFLGSVVCLRPTA
jgi:SAM-dependent methyltransferase